MSVTAFKIPNAEPIADKIRRLREEAGAQARLHAQMLERTLAEAETLAADIAEGGEAYQIGVRETARRLAPELHGVRMKLQALLAREG
jgi:hypothetical protein